MVFILKILFMLMSFKRVLGYRDFARKENRMLLQENLVGKKVSKTLQQSKDIEFLF